MPATLPRSVREALGVEAAEDFEGYLDTFAVRRDEYREVFSRLDIIEHRLDAVEEGQVELRREMNVRFNSMQQHFDTRFDSMDTRLDEMRYQMLVQTRWLIGAVSLFGTIIAILLAIGQLT